MPGQLDKVLMIPPKYPLCILSSIGAAGIELD